MTFIFPPPNPPEDLGHSEVKGFWSRFVRSAAFPILLTIILAFIASRLL